jgi:hypothetical protein
MSRRIFRATALQRHNDYLDKIVLPRYARLPWPAILWALAGLLLVLVTLLWYIQMPIYATGPAVVVRTPTGLAGEGEVALAVFLPVEFASRLRAGQPAIVHLSGLATQGQAVGMRQTVAAVEAIVAAPAKLRARYGLDNSTGLLIDGPAVVALIRLNSPAERLLGSIGEVQIQVDMQRSLALLPGIGRFFRFEGHASR